MLGSSLLAKIVHRILCRIHRDLCVKGAEAVLVASSHQRNKLCILSVLPNDPEVVAIYAEILG